ncbi:class I SAM-dependent methyltransferase [Brachybacterium halotolerans subsp. kimchii]|uniref:class I SAM-dependent methyltransferase n=1 Tax=Brachybacterium halotolerans TaxID=2795215 RepID=UPI001E400B57|nr:methyltransferase [Brachybacterium halotolerans]UEJ82342.1 class I SAM-dependent methyltransferase [Brachybacterium halotolerans subsp. kimchii]
MDSTSPAPSAPSAPGDDRADQTDRVILESARAELGPLDRGDLVVLDDATGALTSAALEEVAGGAFRVLVHEASAQRALALAESHPAARREGRLVIAGLDGTPQDLGGLLEGSAPQVALARLPKALAALDHRAHALARAGVPALVAGGRVKHMIRTQNEVLAGAFDEVHATRGIGKSRALVGRGPRAGDRSAPVLEGGADIRIRGEQVRVPLRGVGGVFGGASADAGSLLLLAALDRAVVAGGAPWAADAASSADAQAASSTADAPGAAGGDSLAAVDLGCGNGLMSVYLRRAFPEARVLATDDDLDAVASTRATLDADADADADAGPGVRVLWESSLAAQAPGSADLVLLNPPFHDGTAVDATLVHGLLDAVSRVLRPGGELWFVHNSHLRYRSEVEHRVGPVRQRARDRRFTVLQATRG